MVVRFLELMGWLDLTAKKMPSRRDFHTLKHRTDRSCTATAGRLRGGNQTRNLLAIDTSTGQMT